LIDQVFKTSDFELFHYFGHSGLDKGRGPSAGRYLTLAKDKRTYRLSDLGELEAERKFFESAPMVVLNCCDGTDISDLFEGADSFPHRFIKNASVAFVGALWPVDSRAANRFVTAFYERLSTSAFVVHALHETRKHILAEARKLDATSKERLFLTLAARAYVYYGPPDLRCAFKKGVTRHEPVS
jgi:CHAT domain-containing protein